MHTHFNAYVLWIPYRVCFSDTKTKKNCFVLLPDKLSREEEECNAQRWQTCARISFFYFFFGEKWKWSNENVPRTCTAWNCAAEIEGDNEITACLNGNEWWRKSNLEQNHTHKLDSQQFILFLFSSNTYLHDFLRKWCGTKNVQQTKSYTQNNRKATKKAITTTTAHSSTEVEPKWIIYGIKI